MTKTNFLFKVFFFSFLFGAFFSPAPTHAIDFSLGIYPPLLKVNIKPGKTITQVFRIDNNSNSNKIVIARLIPFTDADLFGNPSIDPKKQPKWLSYFTLANAIIKFGEPFEIKANSSEQLILSMDIPVIAPMGDIYATMLVSSYQSELGPKTLGSGVIGSIGSNLLITINGQENPTTILSIKSIIPDKNVSFRLGNFYFLDNITPVKFTAIARNEGDYLSESKGIFKIEKSNGQPVQLYSILPQYIISKNERQLSSDQGNFFEFKPSITNIGVFKAKVEVHSQNGNATDFVEIILLPFKAIIGVAVALTLLSIVTRIAYKSPE